MRDVLLTEVEIWLPCHGPPHVRERPVASQDEVCLHLLLHPVSPLHLCERGLSPVQVEISQLVLEVQVEVGEALARGQQSLVQEAATDRVDALRMGTNTVFFSFSFFVVGAAIRIVAAFVFAAIAAAVSATVTAIAVVVVAITIATAAAAVAVLLLLKKLEHCRQNSPARPSRRAPGTS